MSFTKGKALAELAGSPWETRLWSVRTEQDERHYIAAFPVTLQKGRRREPESNARLFAASITAATRAEEMGYDGQAAVEALPELLEAMEDMLYQAGYPEIPSWFDTDEGNEALIQAKGGKA